MPVQELHKARPRFCASQQPRIDGLWAFVQKQRVLRKQVSALCSACM